MSSVEDVVVYVPPVDDQHLSGHALIALHAALAVFKKLSAQLLNRNPSGIGSIDASGQLSLDFDAELIRFPVFRELLALTTALVINPINNEGAALPALGVAPCAFSYFSHCCSHFVVG
jgi:hypothetical protein